MTLMPNPAGRDDELLPDGDTPAQVPRAPRASEQTSAPPPVEPQAVAAPPPSGAQSAVTFDQVMGRIDDLEQSVHKSRGLSARGFYTMAAAFLMLGVGGFTYIGDRVQHTNERVDAVVAELRESEARQTARVDDLAAQLRDSEAKQIERVDDLARELRAEIRSEIRATNERIDALAAELRAAVEVLVDIQGRLRALEASYEHVDSRLVRLETETGLPPLSVAQPPSTPAADG